jgi:hypothetical protein
MPDLLQDVGPCTPPAALIRRECGHRGAGASSGFDRQGVLFIYLPV